MNEAVITPEIKLCRVLSPDDLIFYGIILVQADAALSLFGHANNISRCFAVTTILITLVAIIFTVPGYGV